ncbi:hypothetical protein PV08_02105 [Exophiala spinifera]|uniref:Uncharacterized protein n=1 Tax=Exophiala spinifera TaxID=91928 RepID=A0A0D2BT01_9EURO|nr:uncharacterized protein PV08_02105 [Exophiala spinifera]KIW21525.1 hypothetical protein PV08_02105 [Exophiala spinifera]
MTVPSGSSTATLSIPSGLTQITGTLPDWNITVATITRTDGQIGTGSVSWTADLQTSTRFGDDGVNVIFPFYVWKCVGNLCADGESGGGIVNILDCLFKFLCPNPSNHGWEFPPCHCYGTWRRFQRNRIFNWVLKQFIELIVLSFNSVFLRRHMSNFCHQLVNNYHHKRLFNSMLHCHSLFSYWNNLNNADRK